MSAGVIADDFVETNGKGHAFLSEISSVMVPKVT